MPKNQNDQGLITEEIKKSIAEFQSVYEPGQIHEVIEEAKDLYSCTTEDSADSRTGIILMLKHIADFCECVVKAGHS